jgi:hypothetical protein
MFSTFRKSLLSVTAALAVFAFGSLAPQPAEAGALSNFLTNKIIDFVMRGQAYTPPATVFVALATTTGSSAACGTEATYTGYARVAVTSSLANWSGTQGATTTAVSSGTSGQTSNNVTVSFGAPTSGPTTVTEFCVFDGVTGSNLLWRAPLTTPKTLNNGDAAPSFAISALSWTIQ